MENNLENVFVLHKNIEEIFDQIKHKYEPKQKDEIYEYLFSYIESKSLNYDKKIDLKNFITKDLKQIKLWRVLY
jgi:ribosome-binding ATPase YchF (GTP1/OBG family)